MSKLFWAMIFVILLITGCKGINQEESQLPIQEPYPASGTTTQATLLKPLLTSWGLADNPSIGLDGIRLDVLAIQLSPFNTVLFYSLANSRMDKLVQEYQMQLHDEQGQAYPLLKVLHFDDFYEVELGALIFSPRTVQADAIYLQLTGINEKSETYETATAVFEGNTSLGDDRLSTTYYAAGTDPVRSNDLTIGFWGWGVPPETLPDQRQAKADQQQSIPTTSPWIPQDPGVHVVREITFGVTQQNESTYVSLQLLTNEKLFGLVAGDFMEADEILVNSLAPTPSPAYPPP